MNCLPEEVVQQRSSGSTENGTGCSYIDVDVGEVGPREPGNVFLNPLGAANQTIFLAIPASKDDGTEGLPTSFESLANTAYNFVDGSRAAVGVSCSTGNPGVAVVA